MSTETQDPSESLPPGYINLGPASLHVADVKRFTADINRFRKYLPMVLALWPLAPGCEEEQDIWENAESVDDLLITITEHFDFVQRWYYTQSVMAGPGVEIN